MQTRKTKRITLLYAQVVKKTHPNDKLRCCKPHNYSLTGEACIMPMPSRRIRAHETGHPHAPLGSFWSTGVAFVAVLSCNEPFLSIFPQKCVFAAESSALSGCATLKDSCFSENLFDFSQKDFWDVASTIDGTRLNFKLFSCAASYLPFKALIMIDERGRVHSRFYNRKQNKPTLPVWQ